MNANQLKAEQVYMCSNGNQTAHVYYFGMTEDKYVFIPYNLEKKHFSGIPNYLTESEVKRFINPLKN